MTATSPTRSAVPAAATRVIGALAPWSLGGALPNFAGAEPPRGTLVARRPSAAAVQQAVDPDGMFARTPLP